MKRFLKDENGDVDAIEMRCLKLRVGLHTVMEDTPDQLPNIGNRLDRMFLFVLHYFITILCCF